MAALSNAEVKQLLDLFILYSKKNAFTIEEYGDVDTIYKKMKDFVVKNQSESKAKMTIEPPDLKFLLNMFIICSTRTPVEIHNYKIIADLYTRLGDMAAKEESYALPDLEEKEA